MAPVDDVLEADLSDFGVRPEDACIGYDQCGNLVPGNGEICGPCLDEVRYGTD
jgi:hypothetical protein